MLQQTQQTEFKTEKKEKNSKVISLFCFKTVHPKIKEQ